MERSKNFMLKKFSYVAAAGIMLAALADAVQNRVTLKVWQPQMEQELLAGMAEDFQALHPEWIITFDFGVVEEPDLKTTLTVDVEAGADVFAFPDDQLVDLINAGALAEVQQYKSVVEARDVEWAVDAATKAGKLYAYPETADNGYFLYYDASKLSATDVLTMDAILDKADDLDKSILFDPAGGWQSAAWFLNTGSITFDGTTQTCPWNNAAGLTAAEGMWEAYGRERILSAAITPTSTRWRIIASVTGTWNATAISAVLGDNYAATKLPTFTNGDNVQQQLGPSSVPSLSASTLIAIARQATFANSSPTKPTNSNGLWSVALDLRTSTPALPKN
jgi:arabinogalactan oligomer/maltooligosaccharide transport system substrate-binding protein